MTDAWFWFWAIIVILAPVWEITLWTAVEMVIDRIKRRR